MRDAGFDEDLFNDIFQDKPGETDARPAEPVSESEPAGKSFEEIYNSIDIPHYGGFHSRMERPAEPAAPAEQDVRTYIPKQSEKPIQPQAQAPAQSGQEDEFEIDYDFDSEYQDVDMKKAIHKNRNRRSGCLGGILYFVFVLAVSMVLASAGWIASTDVLALGKTAGEVAVSVPEDFEISDVTDMLYENGLIKYKSLFKLYATYSHADEKIDPGTYVLNTNYDYRALVTGMTSSGGTRIEVSVTIPEGYTMEQIFTLLEENSVCFKSKLYEAAETYDFDYDFLDGPGDALRLEGFLFPDTYTFYMNDTPERVISKLLGNFNNKFNAEYKARAEEMGYTPRDIITVASMIEREAGSEDERAEIASVIYNRLNSGSFTHLQIDATIYYAMALTGKDFSLDLDSPYNTYVCEGLPAGPIANPGMNSIFAALYPESTDYYYYALRTDGVHEFFSSERAFNNFINSDQYGG